MEGEEISGQLIKRLICSRCNKEKVIYNKSQKLCKSCYNFTKRTPEKSKEYNKKFKESHPNYFKEYFKKNKGVKHGKIE